MRAVFFDLSGVLFSNGTACLLEEMARGRSGGANKLKEILSGPQSWALRRGEIEPTAFWNAVADVIERETGLNVAAFRMRWLQSFTPQEGMHELLADLAARGHPLGIIAETPGERVAALEERFPWLALAERRFWSFETGLDKRDGALFRYAMDRLGPFAEPPMMVEDEQAAARHARKAGFNAVIFHSAQTLRRDYFS